MNIPPPRPPGDGGARPGHPLARFADGLFLGVACTSIVAAPAMLGSSGPWARLALETAMATMAVIWASFRCRSPRPMLVVLGVCAVASLQSIPLPPGLLETVAPGSARAWQVARAELPATWATISVDPAATATGIRRMFLWMATTLAVGDAVRRRTPRRWLGGALAASAALVWTLALLFPVEKPDPKLLGTFPLWGPTEEFWMNGDRLPVQSDGGGFLAWATIGGERYRYDQVMAGDGVGPFWSSNQFACTVAITLPFLLAVPMAMGIPRRMRSIALAVVAGVGAGALWVLWRVTESRAGSVSLVVATLVFLQAIVEGRWTRRVAAAAAVTAIVSIGIFLAGYTGIVSGIEHLPPRRFQGRLEALVHNNRAEGTRVAGVLAGGSPWFGVGIDAYSALYPVVVPGDYAFYYAYDEYAQCAAETGIVGCAAALLLSLPLLAAMTRSRASNGSGRPLDAATVGALAGVATNMFFEWSLHQPANGFLSAVVVGLATAVGAERGDGPAAAPDVPAGSTRAVGWGFAVVCILAVATLARDARSDVVWREFRQALGVARAPRWRGARPDPRPLLERAIALGEQAAPWDPCNPRLALVRGQAHRHLAEMVEADRETHLASAEECFLWCRRLSAATMGLPEPSPGAMP